MSEYLRFINTVILFPFGIKIILHSGFGNSEAQGPGAERVGRETWPRGLFPPYSFQWQMLLPGRISVFPTAIMYIGALR